MSFFDGLQFFMVMLAGMVPAVIMGLCGKNLRYYSLGFSLVMIFLIYRENPREFLYLVLFVFLEWHVIALYQWLRRKYGHNKVIFHHFVLVALLPLALSKITGLMGGTLFSFLGISYVTFRVVQIIIESYDGLIEKSGFLDTVSFLVFFPTLSSGPIDRSKRFESDLYLTRTRKEYLEVMAAGLWKLMLGVAYKFVLSAIAFDVLERLSVSYSPLYLVGYAYVYGVYMFFDFAGYSLMAVGASYVLGICTPDNFRKPFLSIDMKDFWDRWHITLSHWFRDFIFSRYMMAAIRAKRFSSRLNAAASGFIVNMLIMGVWHGLTKDYILYGLYHGVLLALTEIYQKKSGFYKRNKGKRWYKLLSWFVTLNLVMFGFLIFSGRFFEALSALGNMVL